VRHADSGCEAGAAAANPCAAGRTLLERFGVTAARALVQGAKGELFQDPARKPRIALSGLAQCALFF
jgi:hypothetical protein